MKNSKKQFSVFERFRGKLLDTRKVSKTEAIKIVKENLGESNGCKRDRKRY